MMRINSANGIALKPDFIGEREYHFDCLRRGIKSIYLTTEEKEKHKFTYDENGIFRINGEVARGRYLYTRLLDGTIYGYKIDSSNSNNGFHHSYFTDGENVLSAGYFEFQEFDETNECEESDLSEVSGINDNTNIKHKVGTMLSVSNESGHFTPTNEEMLSEVDFYFSIAKNPTLIYEDHTRAPTEKKIYRYEAKEFIKHKNINSILPIETRLAKNSHYGQTLESSTAEIFKRFADQSKTFKILPGYVHQENAINENLNAAIEANLSQHPTHQYEFQPDEQLLSIECNFADEVNIQNEYFTPSSRFP